MRNVQEEVKTAIESLEIPEDYWAVVNALIDYNAAIFIGAISNAYITKIDNLSAGVSPELLDSIIHKSFEIPKKLKGAIKLLKPCSGLLSQEQKEFILNRCEVLPSPEAFYDLFKLTRITPDSSVKYLLRVNTPASAFTIYRIFFDAKRNKMLRADSKFASLHPNVVAQLCDSMKESCSYASQLASMLIRSQILLTDKMDKWLLKEIVEDGYDGFYRIVAKKEQKEKLERNATSISKGDKLTNLLFVKSLDNYHLFIEKDSNAYAFLDKKLAIGIPSKDTYARPTVIDIKTRHGKRVFFVAQNSPPFLFLVAVVKHWGCLGDKLSTGC